MEVEVKIDEKCTTPKIVIHTNEITTEINELVERLSEKQPFNLIGYKNEKLEILQLDEIVRIYAEQQKVYAKTDKDVFTLKLRLYEVENKLYSSNFIRISNSEIVNFKKIKNLDISYNGTICIIFKSGDKSYVSRRYVMKIKKFLGV
ncbi:LytTR family DNA-binding domain-containing protein [Brassicibacter mesophilus]|uniref:LytTR family DNA-binding domain-containing protein n=1 Tax=Brassicibacter mesophilus TaxID=745119 RepID=UPI003D1EA725